MVLMHGELVSKQLVYDMFLFLAFKSLCAFILSQSFYQASYVYLLCAR